MEMTDCLSCENSVRCLFCRFHREVVAEGYTCNDWKYNTCTNDDEPQEIDYRELLEQVLWQNLTKQQLGKIYKELSPYDMANAVSDMLRKK